MFTEERQNAMKCLREEKEKSGSKELSEMFRLKDCIARISKIENAGRLKDLAEQSCHEVSSET